VRGIPRPASWLSGYFGGGVISEILSRFLGISMLCEEENFHGPLCASNSSSRAAARRGNLRLRGGTLWQSIHVNNGTEKSDKKNSSIDRGFQKENVVIASSAPASGRSPWMKRVAGG
jgi:hypothetical protein